MVMGVVRKTKSVKLLLAQFEHSSNAVSSVSLIDRLTGQMNKTTVYRILERLEDDGILHSFKGTDGLQWYAKCEGCDSMSHSDLHPHFQCKECGKTECLELVIPVPKIPNHSVDQIELLITGSCADCS